MNRAIIIGAGPAGLTAAYELLRRTDIRPLLLEMTDRVGGIARTPVYKGNRIDIGGHMFFSKSDRVLQWWLQMLPLQKLPTVASVPYGSRWSAAQTIDSAPDPETTDRVMLLRTIKNHIYFLGQFFDYPPRLNIDTVRKLGLIRTAKIGLSYFVAALSREGSPKNLEEFYVSRFGRELYCTFFKSYTEKVCGQCCSQVSADWGTQRLKGLSMTKALGHAVRSMFLNKLSFGERNGETLLAQQFLYPKYGPGQMWETTAQEVLKLGGEIVFNNKVTKLVFEGDRVQTVEAVDTGTGQLHRYTGDYVFSSMPVADLVLALKPTAPRNVCDVAAGLPYRAFVTVGLLVNKRRTAPKGGSACEALDDQTIYVQDPCLLLGRVQVLENWSPYLVANPGTGWLAAEYFCNETDELWQLSDDKLTELAITELATLGLLDREDVLDANVIREPKAYPGYYGTYSRFSDIRKYFDQFSNLFLIGRNGTHKYASMDQTMLTAMTAVDNVVAGIADKDNIWEVDPDAEHQEAHFA